MQRAVAFLALTIAALLAAALPASAGAPFQPAPNVGGGSEITVGADGALWSIESVYPTVLSRVTTGGEHSIVTIPNSAAASDLAPGIAGDAVWVADESGVHGVTADGAVSLVADVGALGLEPSPTGDEMSFVGGGWRVGTISSTGQVTARSVPVSDTGGLDELVLGPQDTLWTSSRGQDGDELVRVNADMTVTRIPVSGYIVGPPALGPDGLLWVPLGTTVQRFRADGSKAPAFNVPAPVGAAVVGPDGSVYFSTTRGYLKVSATGEARPVLEASTDLPDAYPGESVLFDGDLYYTGDGERRPGRLDLTGQPVPLVNVFADGGVSADHTVTLSVTVTGDGAVPQGTVTVMDGRCCEEGATGYTPAATVTLDAQGRARITFKWTPQSHVFYVDYSGSNTYTGTTSLTLQYSQLGEGRTERYITQTYEDLLNRQPEPAGMQYWTGELDQGTPRTAVSYALAISSEHRERFVDALFADYLNRSAERAGRDSFVADLSRGATMNQIRASILGSQEYYVRFGGGTVDGYITALYQEVLNRQPDAQGRAFWSGELARGVSKPTMASALLNSQEALRRLVGARFQQLLRRSVDSGGRDYWVSLLQQGFREERLIAELIGSDEYYAAAVAGRY